MLEPTEWETDMMLNELMNDLQKAVIDVQTSDIPVLIGELEKLRVTLPRNRVSSRPKSWISRRTRTFDSTR